LFFQNIYFDQVYILIIFLKIFVEDIYLMERYLYLQGIYGFRIKDHNHKLIIFSYCILCMQLHSYITNYAMLQNAEFVQSLCIVLHSFA